MTAACDASTCVDCRCKQVSQVKVRYSKDLCRKNCFFVFLTDNFKRAKKIWRKTPLLEMCEHIQSRKPCMGHHSVEINLSSLIKGQNGSYKFLCLLCCSYLLWIKVKDNTAVVLTSCPRPVAPFNSIQYITYSTVLMEISLPVQRPLLLFSR